MSPRDAKAPPDRESGRPALNIDSLIQPGKRVGGFALGTTRAAVVEAVGPPNRIFLGDSIFAPDNAPEGAYHAYFELHLRFRYANDRVVEIGVVGPSFRLEGDLGVATKQAEMIAALGPPERDQRLPNKRVLHYPSRGLEMVLDHDGGVICIVVTPPAAYPGPPATSPSAASPSAASTPVASASEPGPAGALATKSYHYRDRTRFFRRVPPQSDQDVEAICYEDNAEYRRYVELLNELVFLDHDHGLGHAHRVATLSMAFYTQLEPEGSEGSEGSDAVRYYLMGFLHDLGRMSGGADPAHGQRSTEIIGDLGLELSPQQLEAIRTHTVKQYAQTLAEQCLFDADRLDLSRFGRALQPQWLSPSLQHSLEPFTTLATLFARNRHCCFIPPQLRHREAMRWLIYLHRHLDYLRPRRLYHGSLTPGIDLLQSPMKTFPIHGNCLFATPDPAEAAYIVQNWRESNERELSIYELEPVGYREIEFNFLGIEYVFGEPTPPRREYRVPRDPERSGFDQYPEFRLPWTWREIGS